jgi:hypothetical protein
MAPGRYAPHSQRSKLDQCRQSVNKFETRNESEIIFEEFCTDAAIPFTRIERTGKPTPDYEITLGGHTVVTEVKQLDRNDDDDRAITEARAKGIEVGWSEPGRRVRLKFQTAGKQLKERSQGKLPTMLVIHDNGTFGGTDRDDIKTAMYGDETIVLRRSDDGTTLASPIHAGGQRKCTPNSNKTISAVGLLYRGSGNVRLSVFHNHHAIVPIDPDWFRAETLRHFGCDPDNPDVPYEWCCL